MIDIFIFSEKSSFSLQNYEKGISFYSLPHIQKRKRKKKKRKRNTLHTLKKKKKVERKEKCNGKLKVIYYNYKF